MGKWRDFPIFLTGSLTVGATYLEHGTDTSTPPDSPGRDHSVGANSAHGLRRTNADKHKAVMTLLHDDEWSGWTNREIARHCAVSHSMVNDLRASLEESSSEKPAKRTYTDKHGNTSTMNTENIGKGSALTSLSEDLH